jgi:hypothetical protein
MMKLNRVACATALLTLCGGVAADDLTGSQSFICTGWHAVTCNTEGVCDNTEAWKLNMPDFLRVDLRGKELFTPEGSDQPRASPIESIAREDNILYLNGRQGARGWSWIVNEASGEGTLALVSENSSVTIFTACTSMEGLE